MSREEDLIRVYRKAQQELIKTIATKQAKGSVVWYQEALLRQVNQILAQLNAYSSDWVREAINAAYALGAAEAVSGLVNLGVSASGVDTFATLHKAAIDVIVSNAQSMLFRANGFVGRQIEDSIRKVGLDAVANKLATGQTLRQMKKSLIQDLVDKGFNGIMDKRGRMISLDAYAATVARSTTREATNTATMNQLEYEGYDLVKMSTHATTCPVCAVYQGRVYSISGRSKDYPALSIAFSGGYNNVHPNCRHVVFPYIPSLADNPVSDRLFSNRPFNIDPRSRTAIEAYNARQKEQRQIRADRDQFRRYSMVLGSDAPKSFAGFRRSKAANSDKFRQMQSDYREYMSQ